VPPVKVEHDGETVKERSGWDIYIWHPLDDYKFEMKYFCNAKLGAQVWSFMWG
jgi:hypothetical protein